MEEEYKTTILSLCNQPPSHKQEQQQEEGKEEEQEQGPSPFLQSKLVQLDGEDLRLLEVLCEFLISNVLCVCEKLKSCFLLFFSNKQ